MNMLIDFCKYRPYLSSFIFGLLTSASFAPLFFVPALVFVGFFAFSVSKVRSFKQAFWAGYFYGFGYFLSGLYWIAIGVSVYATKFWWAIPIALFGIPLFFAQFFGVVGILSYFFSSRILYPNSFAAAWVLAEWVRSWAYTGFPWNLAGYSLAFEVSLIQVTSLYGIYGLSVMVILSAASFYYLLSKRIYSFLFWVLIVIAPMWYFSYDFGVKTLKAHPLKFSNVKVRLVQPSIAQSEKWSYESFWANLKKHIDMSQANLIPFRPDIVIWPESAVVVQPTYTVVYNMLKSFTSISNTTLITGGITDNQSNPQRSKDKIFASIYALDSDGNLIFDYHKSHLVPFGEYVPFSDYISYMNKLTPGDQEYSAGYPGFIVSLSHLGLNIRPLLCYEIIFPGEVLMSNKDVDWIMNLTNDAWYGVSGGPYQHYYMSRIRAVESRMPLVRVANNGISAVIDPFGRIVNSTTLNQVIAVDAYLPRPIREETFYYQHKNKYLYIYLIISFLLPLLRKPR